MTPAISLEDQLRASLDLVHARHALSLVPPPAPREGRALPAECYYEGTDLRVPLPPLLPVDETRPLTPSDLDARRLAAQGRAGLIRFFAGRWSRRLGRVVRPS